MGGISLATRSIDQNIADYEVEAVHPLLFLMRISIWILGMLFKL